METQGSSWSFISADVPIPSVSNRGSLATFWRTIVARIPWKKLLHMTTSTYDHDVTVHLW